MNDIPLAQIEANALTDQ